MDVNYNPIMKYNLYGGDLAIVLLVIVLSDDMQLNVKHKLDFDDLKSISQKRPSLVFNVMDNILYKFFYCHIYYNFFVYVRITYITILICIAFIIKKIHNFFRVKKKNCTSTFHFTQSSF
jgi:hypothetical protein